jgi:acyl carrier protein
LSRGDRPKSKEEDMSTPTAEQVQQRVRQALEEFGADPSRIEPDAELAALDVDSLDLVELTQIVEEEYGLKLDREDFEDVVTVRQAVDLVVSKLP